MEEKQLVEWIISKNTREILLIATILGSTIFLLYGIFNGKPPLLKEANIDEKGRKISLTLGVFFLSVFFLTLTIPIIYDLVLNDSIEVYINNTPADSKVTYVAINDDKKIIKGKIEVKKKGKENSKAILSLKSIEQEIEFYEKPLTFFARRGEKYLEVAKGGNSRIHIADDAGKLWGPLLLKDSSDRKIGEIPTYNYGSIVIPENARVEFYNAALLYRDEVGTMQKKWVGSKLDFEKFDYGVHTDILQEWQTPKCVEIRVVSDVFDNKVMRSGVKYKANKLIASSSLFPLGTELLISNPLIKSTPVSAIVQDSASTGILVLSPAVFEVLQFELDSKARADIQVVDYHAKIPKN